jgi:hypothetical protein
VDCNVFVRAALAVNISVWGVNMNNLVDAGSVNLYQPLSWTSHAEKPANLSVQAIIIVTTGWTF